jgi:hypothetical protein
VATGILSIKFAMSCGRSISGERRAGDKFGSFTEGHIRLFTQFLMVNNYTCEMNTISAIELNNLLCKFFVVVVRQKNGEEYEPSYLREQATNLDHLRKILW